MTRIARVTSEVINLQAAESKRLTSVTFYNPSISGQVLSKVTDPAGFNLVSTYQYDTDRRLTKKSSCGGCGGTGQAIYSYDDQDRVTGVRLLESDPMSESYYDVWSRVTKIHAPIGTGQNEYAEAANDYVIATTDYNGAGAVTKATDPRGYNTTFLYDVDRQLTKIR
jgi:YD repeat-containing protein